MTTSLMEPIPARVATAFSPEAPSADSRGSAPGWLGNPPLRPAWIDIDGEALASNFRILRAELSPSTRLLYVVKDDAYGLGAPTAARVALANGADELGVFTLSEGLALRQAGLTVPILLLGERSNDEFKWALGAGLTPCVGDRDAAFALNDSAQAMSIRARAHIKINTGMNRFGFHWRYAAQWAAEVRSLESVEWAGALSHLAQSDEADKTFAREQASRFHEALGVLSAAGIRPQTRHLANSGAFLDLPEMRLELVRIGILALGVYPSEVCRRLPGLAPVLSVKARICALQHVSPGDTVGYGMRYRAESPRLIGVLPIGYGDGFPRVRNEGRVLVRGRFAPIVGGISMDAITVDLTDIPGAARGDEAVLLGRQNGHEITAGEVALLKRSVSYDLLAGLRSRLPRRWLGLRPS